MTETNSSHDRYDAITITFHWLTALLVVVLFGTSLIWNYGPRGLDRDWYQALHISVGIGLAAVLVARLLWRLFGGRHLAGSGTLVTDILSRIVHGLLYVLLAAQVGFGFSLRWFQGEEFTFFGWLEVPQLIAANRGLEHTVENLHNLTAWSIIILAGGHAVVALVHRYVFKDGILKRMVPFAG